MGNINITLVKSETKGWGCAICNQCDVQYVHVLLQLESSFDGGQIELFLRDDDKANYCSWTENNGGKDIEFDLCEYDFWQKFFPIADKALEHPDSTKFPKDLSEFSWDLSRFPLKFAIPFEDFKIIIKENRYKKLR